MAGQLLLHTHCVQVVPVVGLLVLLVGEVQGGRGVAGLSGGGQVAGRVGGVLWPVVVPRVCGGRWIAVVGRLGHSPGLVVILRTSVWPVGSGAKVRRSWGSTVVKIWREHVMGRGKVPWHSIRWREEGTRRPVWMRRERHPDPHVRGEPAASDELHLVDSLLLASLVLEPDLDHSHRQPRVFG